jgi:membrane protease YdiL (CAAX protease family)
MDTDTILLIVAEWIGVIAVGMLAGLSPQLQKIRPLQFLFPRREASVTLSTNAILFVFSIFLYIRFFTTAIEPGVNQPEILWQRILLDLIALAAFGAALYIRKQPVRSALWGRDALRPNIQFGFLLIMLSIFLRGRVFAIINGVDANEGLALVQWLIISLCEVSIFFGFSQPRLIARFGENIGWIASAILFALWQIIPLALHGTDGQTALLQVALAIGQGFLLGWITRKSRHCLAPILYLAASQWLFLIK